MAEPTGVYTAQKKDGSIYYRSSITCLQKHISLGSYSEYDTALRAFTEARGLFNEPKHRFSPDYQPSALSFEKYVILMNFRDNHIYFHNPIYAYRSYFYYYVSQDYVLTFDTDDLFYFASHKILKRGGHLFVSDYGMQTGLLTHFGIKPYAVIGRDYEFINGDPTDFRYENLSILNSYQGVHRYYRRGRDTASPEYKAYLHIRSTYCIGCYKSAVDAAIAYNKAVDIVKKNGCKKQFLQNYVEELLPSEYAHIYASLRISDTICRLRFTSGSH